MTDSTVVVLGLTPYGELHECEVCLARWSVPLGAAEDDVEIREYRQGLIAEHVCDPFVDPSVVAAIRARADELAAQVGPCPLDMTAPVEQLSDDCRELLSGYSEAVRPRGELLALEFDYDAASFRVAYTGVGWVDVAGDIVQAAHSQALRATENPRRRALQLARCAVYQLGPALRPDPRGFRPADVRLAMTLLADVRGDEKLLTWSPEVSDADALAWLAAFERDACGVF